MRWAALVVFACGGRGGTESKPAPKVAPDGAVAVVGAVAPDANAVAPPLDARDDDLPGRYAVVVVQKLRGSHNMQIVRFTSRASMVIELADDGGATLCHGVASHDTIDGDDFHSDDQRRDQHGYRGTYAVVDEVAKLSLTFDETVCPTIHESDYEDRPPKALELECSRGDIVGHAVLACSASGASDFMPFHITELAERGFLLGPSPGLELGMTGRPEPGYFGGPKREATITRATARIEAGAWDE